MQTTRGSTVTFREEMKEEIKNKTITLYKLTYQPLLSTMDQNWSWGPVGGTAMWGSSTFD